MLNLPWPEALERYSEKFPRVALRVYLRVDGLDDIVLIYRGFSSSLVRSTPPSLNQPVMDPDSLLLRLDRLQAPVHPTQPQILEAGLDRDAVIQLLEKVGLSPSGWPDPV